MDRRWNLIIFGFTAAISFIPLLVVSGAGACVAAAAPGVVVQPYVLTAFTNWVQQQPGEACYAITAVMEGKTSALVSYVTVPSSGDWQPTDVTGSGLAEVSTVGRGRALPTGVIGTAEISKIEGGGVCMAASSQPAFDVHLEDVRAALGANLEKSGECFAIADVDDRPTESLISVVGLNAVTEGQNWNLNQNPPVWFGLVFTQKSIYTATAAKPQVRTASVTALRAWGVLPPAPASVMVQPPNPRFVFPWQNQTTMRFEHSSSAAARNQFDFVAGAGTTATAPNAVFAMEDGIVVWRCSDDYQYIIQIEGTANLQYWFLDRYWISPALGSQYQQGDQISISAVGAINGACGKTDWTAGMYGNYIVGEDITEMNVEGWNLEGAIPVTRLWDNPTTSERVYLTEYMTATWGMHGGTPPAMDDTGPANIWDPIVDNYVNAAENFRRILPQHTPLYLSERWQIALHFTLDMWNMFFFFRTTVMVWVLRMVITLEIVRATLSIWLWIKKTLSFL